MFPANIEKSLTEVELYFGNVSAALVSGEPVALEAASSALRQAVIEFSGLLQRSAPLDLKDQALKLRLKTLSSGLAAQREVLIRRTVWVERGLNALIPAARTTAHAQSTGNYATLGKQARVFN